MTTDWVAWILAPLAILSGSMAAVGADHSQWEIVGDSTVVTSESTVGQLIGILPASSAGFQRSVSVRWNDAELRGPDGVAIPVSFRLDLIVGRTMALADSLITKVEDARGRLTAKSSGRRSLIELAERGDWFAKFIHSDAANSNHLAVELPFSMIDAANGALIAQSTLRVDFDLSDRSKPTTRGVTVYPSPFAELRLATTDIGSALLGSAPGGAAPAADYHVYRANVSSAELTTTDEVGTESAPGDASAALERSGIGSSELVLESPGFSNRNSSSPPFTLRLRYISWFPFNALDQRVAYVQPVSGQLAFHAGSQSRFIELGPGNFGHIYGLISLRDDVLHYSLGLAFHERSEPVAVGRLDTICRIDSGPLSCSQLWLATAMDAGGRIVSPRSLSDLLIQPAAPGRPGAGSGSSQSAGASNAAR